MAMLLCGSTALADDAQEQVETELEGILDGLEWGMSYTRVFERIESRIRETYRERLSEARNDVLEQDRILEQMRAKVAKVKRDFVVFDGQVSGWDVSAIGPEFRRGSHEAMLVYDDDQSRNYFFFMRGRLWKWYREFKPTAFGGADFDALSEAFAARFGDSELQAGKRLEGSAMERWRSWDGVRTQLIAVDRGSLIAFVLLDRRVKGQLANLRRDALPRGQQRRTIVDAVFMTEAEREAFRNGRSTAGR